MKSDGGLKGGRPVAARACERGRRVRAWWGGWLGMYANMRETRATRGRRSARAAQRAGGAARVRTILKLMRRLVRKGNRRGRHQVLRLSARDDNLVKEDLCDGLLDVVVEVDGVHDDHHVVARHDVH